MITVNGRTGDERIKGEHEYGEVLYAIDRIASRFTLSELGVKRPQTLAEARDNKTALLAAYEGSKDIEQNMEHDRGLGSTPQLVRENKLLIDRKLRCGRKYMNLMTRLGHDKFVAAKKLELVDDPNNSGKEIPMGKTAAEEEYLRAVESAWSKNLEINPYWDQRHWPEWFASLMSSSGDEAFQWLVDPANACKLGVLCDWEPHRQMQLMNHMMPITPLMRATADPTVLDTATDLRSYINDFAKGTTAAERAAQKEARQQAFEREMAERARKSRAFTSRSWTHIGRKKAREIEGNTRKYQRADGGETHQELTEASVAILLGLAPAKSDGKRKAEEALDETDESSDSDLEDPAIVRRRKAHAAKAARIAA